MTSREAVPRRLPSRPVADTPVEALLARAEDLTKGWLLALLEERQLDDAPAILAADLVREGPPLCDAVVRALADDNDLRRLEPGGALERLASRAGELAGTSQAEPSARAVDVLRAVIWSALREELVHPEADLVEALAERLALVTDLVRAAVLRRFAAVEGEGRREAPVRLAEVVTIGDEAGVGAPEGIEEPDGEALWRGALEHEIAMAQRSGSKLALLLAELGDADRVTAAEPLHEASETFGRFAQAVRGALRREDILACETESRTWVIARSTGRTGARALGARVAAAVQAAEPWRGAPLTVGIGIAVLGEDAHDAIGLIEAADDWTFAAVSAWGTTAESPEHGGADDAAVEGGLPGGG